MIVLGIETSCDETAAALVEETGDRGRPWRVQSSVVASQSAIHSEWGGVVPELSARQHIRDICGVVERALAEAGIARFDGVAVTQDEQPLLVTGSEFSGSLGIYDALSGEFLHRVAPGNLTTVGLQVPWETVEATR